MKKYAKLSLNYLQISSNTQIISSAVNGREKMAVENISRPITMKECLLDPGTKLRTPEP